MTAATGPDGEVLLRDAQPADCRALQAIYADHVQHGLASFEEIPPDLAEMKGRLAKTRALGLPYIVAEGPGKDGGNDAGIHGFAYAGPYRARPAYRFALENSVYVRRGREGRGIGRCLLGRLIESCEALGYRQMIAVIGDSANQASIHLHEKLGFRQAGCLRSIGFKHGQWVDSVLMQRALGPGDNRLPDD